MPAKDEKVEIGPLTHLVVVPVGWLKATAAIMGGPRDIEVIPRGGISPKNLREGLDALEPGERIDVTLTKESVDGIPAASKAWLVVEDGIVFITNAPDPRRGGDPARRSSSGELVSGRGPADFELLPAVYGGGITGYVGSRSEWQQGFVRREIWWLELVPDQIRVWRALGSVKAEREMVRSQSWDQVHSVMFEEGGTSASVAALATFGLLGLGARKNWSVITVAFSDETAVFVIYKLLHHMRPLHDALIREGVPPDKMVFGGGVSTERTQGEEPLPQGLERLAAMYKQGLLTDEEYASAKRRLIEGS